MLAWLAVDGPVIKDTGPRSSNILCPTKVASKAMSALRHKGYPYASTALSKAARRVSPRLSSVRVAYTQKLLPPSIQPCTVKPYIFNFSWPAINTCCEPSSSCVQQRHEQRSEAADSSSSSSSSSSDAYVSSLSMCHSRIPSVMLSAMDDPLASCLIGLGIMKPQHNTHIWCCCSHTSPGKQGSLDDSVAVCSACFFQMTGLIYHFEQLICWKVMPKCVSCLPDPAGYSLG